MDNKSFELKSLKVVGTDTDRNGNIKDDLLWDYGQNEQVFSRDKIITYGDEELFGHKC